jgi:hypothetical protein
MGSPSCPHVACVRRHRDSQECSRDSRRRRRVRITAAARHLLAVVLVLAIASPSLPQVSAAAAAKENGVASVEGWSEPGEGCAVVVSWEEEGPEEEGRGKTTRNRMAVRTSPNKKARAWNPINFWMNPFGTNGSEEGAVSTVESNSRLRNLLSSASSDSTIRARVLQDDQPHPLRTGEWQLRVQWRKRRAVFGHPPTLVLDFDPAGYVRCRRPVETADGSDSDRKATRVHGSIGTWELTPTGLSWAIGLDDDAVDADDVDDDDVVVAGAPSKEKARQASPSAHHTTTASRNTGTGVYLFHADLHLHPFGPRPRLSRGVVLHERSASSSRSGGGSSPSRWFRPVVATFSGVGIGRDTVDLSYRGRRRR